ncbi:hypothetical protein ACQYI1_001940 [Enterobacter mori]
MARSEPDARNANDVSSLTAMFPAWLDADTSLQTADASAVARTRTKSGIRRM